MAIREKKEGGEHYFPPPIPKNRREVEAAGVKVLVGIPMERTVTDVAFISFWEIAQRGWSLIRRGYGRKDVNRNRFAQVLLDSDFTHLLMMDLDHVHPSDIVERHARWVMQDPTREVVAGLHFRRGEPFDPCVYLWGEDGRLHAPAEWGQELYPVAATGFGSVLISRTVFEKLPKPWFANDYSLAEQDGWPGEDMFFSHLCRKHGITIWCDFTTTSPHMITNVVDQNSFKAYLEDHPGSTMVDNGPSHLNPHEGNGKGNTVRLPDIKTVVDA